MSRHKERSLVAVVAEDSVTDNFTYVQKGELELAECLQPFLGNFGLASVIHQRCTDAKLREAGECCYELGCLVADVITA